MFLIYICAGFKEREAAGRLARSQAGKAMRQDVAQEVKKAKTFTPGKPAGEEQKLTDEHRAIYAERIARATTVDEVSQRERLPLRFCTLSSSVDVSRVYGVFVVVLRVPDSFLSAFRSRGYGGSFPFPHLHLCLIQSELKSVFHLLISIQSSK